MLLELLRRGVVGGVGDTDGSSKASVDELTEFKVEFEMADGGMVPWELPGICTVGETGSCCNDQSFFRHD